MEHPWVRGLNVVFVRYLGHMTKLVAVHIMVNGIKFCLSLGPKSKLPCRLNVVLGHWAHHSLLTYDPRFTWNYLTVRSNFIHQAAKLCDRERCTKQKVIDDQELVQTEPQFLPRNQNGELPKLQHMQNDNPFSDSHIF